MKQLLFILVFITFLLPNLSAEQRIQNKDFDLSMEIQGDKLLVTLRGETEGWVSFGIGAEDIMKGANILLFWVDDDLGITMGEDHYGNGRFSHKSDLELGGNQDFEILTGKQGEDFTEVSFTIPLDSGDVFDKPLQAGESYRVLLASSKSDNIKRKHNRRYAEDLILQ